MTGSPMAPVIIPVVVVIVLAAWLALVFTLMHTPATPHALLRQNAASPARPPAATRGNGMSTLKTPQAETGSHSLRSRMARTLAANPRGTAPGRPAA